MIIIEKIASHLSSPPLLIPSLLLCPPEQEQVPLIRSTNHHNGHFQDDDQTQMCEFALGPTVAAWAIVRQMKPDQTSRNIVFIWKVKWRQCVFPLGFAHCFHFSVARNDILKGILHQKNFYRLNLIFWIVMGCGIARFGRRGLKTTET